MNEKLHIVTYATHKTGRFEELINNKYNLNITVLGFGTKWKGYNDKIIGLQKFCKKINKKDIIVFIDAFDTIINKNPKNLLKEFKKFNTNILVSKHPSSNDYITIKIFGNFEVIANAGMYMGYVEDLELLCKEILDRNINDDQIALNQCIYNPKKKLNIKIDENNIIFKNHPIYNFFTNDTYDSFFVSYPGGSQNSFRYKLNRYRRALSEYLHFFKLEALILLLLILIIKLILKYRYK